MSKRRKRSGNGGNDPAEADAASVVQTSDGGTGGVQVDRPCVRDRVGDLVRVPAGELAGAPWNWRKHPKRQEAAVVASLEELGIYAPLLGRRLADGTVELIDGHLRRVIFQRLGPATLVPVVLCDLDEAEARKANLLHDPLAGLAEVDAGKLDELLRTVQTPSQELAGVLDELAKDAGLDWASGGGAAGEAGAGGDEFDATPAEDGPTRTAVGDLWVIRGGGREHRLLVGDCTDAAVVGRLMGGVKADLIVTDPPYGVDFKRGQFITDPSRRSSRARGVGDDIANDDRKAEDQQEFMRAAFTLARNYARPACSVYMWSATLAEGSHSMLGLSAAGVHIQSQLIWVKNNLVLGIADYHWKHEICWYGWYEGAPHRWFGERNKTTILEFARVNSTEHPNEKPVELIGHLIGNSSLEGEVVLDLFLGSGTTLIAAHRLGRTCYGCEIEPRYADVILRRAEAEGLTCEKA